MRKSPKSEANKITTVLRTLGVDQFPVKVRDVALEYSKAVCPQEPITSIRPVPIPNFEGMLKKSPKGDQWIIGVNEDGASSGRINFTIAHEFAHYILHRDLQQDFRCVQRDMHTWDALGKKIEMEADVFASYLLMPADDFRNQIDGHELSIELLRHCADRYDVSLTAAALKWRELAPGRVIVFSAKEGFLDWSSSNERAFKSGAYFATTKQTIEVPASSLLSHATRLASGQVARIDARVWFPSEPEGLEIVEHAFVVKGDGFDYTLGILILPDNDRTEVEDEDLLSPLTGNMSFR
ncbi:Zn-dependent peptidase ImmA (M78 family) [Pseudomonas sp. SJZ080]|uniref:ImmA/IrrE family metallo-endopeptidase n=1 Tax=Pseudomonas sp. SJZ080 TaxID=2572888 RepID=UPI00119BE9F9|nr:ImmA/IrrE family metallo-endopeptidase [Pseudomonas sp. SJZ080]TWC50929.1 Zn-dependent peptidase ImmA (M78 family) [Pseudomonas sp. SJZ080]